MSNVVIFPIFLGLVCEECKSKAVTGSFLTQLTYILDLNSR